MKIWIDDTAFQTSAGFIFPARTVESLHTLKRADFELGWDPEKLNDEQRKLLQQEALESDFKRSSEANCKVARPDDDSSGLNVVTLEGAPQISTAILEGWPEVTRALLLPVRRITETRSTRETDIKLELNLDGTGEADIDTGLNFFNHMLEQIARHGQLDMDLKVAGDLEVDEHHTIEDVGIVLGEAIHKALTHKGGLERYGFVLPMDESEARVSIDLSGRPYFVFKGGFSREYVGDFPTEMAEHFFHTMAMQMNATLHISVSGANDHHQLEACFKGFARALKDALRRDPRSLNILPTSKGKL